MLPLFHCWHTRAQFACLMNYVPLPLLCSATQVKASYKLGEALKKKAKKPAAKKAAAPKKADGERLFLAPVAPSLPLIARTRVRAHTPRLLAGLALAGLCGNAS